MKSKKYLKSGQSFPSSPYVVTGFVPAPLVEDPVLRQKKSDTLKAYREGRKTLTVEPPGYKEIDSGAKVIPLYPKSNQRA